MKNNRSIWKIIALILAILLVLGVIFYLFKQNLFADGMFHGGDEAAHMFLPKYVVDYFAKHHRIPEVNPYWYNGTETLHHAPYLVYFPIAAIYLATGNIYLTDRLITLLILMLAGLTMFYLLYRRVDLKGAIAGGIIFPYTVGIFYLARTSLTRVTPFVLMPLAFYFTDEVLEKKFNLKNFALLSLIIAAMIFAHPITGLSSMVLLAFYCFMRVLTDRQIPFSKFMIWLGSFILGSGLIAWYAIPFVLEPTNYSYPAESIITTIGNSFNTQWPLMGGFFLILFGLISFLRHRNSKNWALFLSVLFAFFLVTPLAAPIYHLFPWGYPFAALLWISVVLIYWTVSVFDFPRLKRQVLIAINVLGLSLIVFLTLLLSNQNTAFLRLWVEPFKNPFPQLEQSLRELKNPGRVFYVKGASKLDWVVPAESGEHSTEGHYFSITRLNKEIAWANDAFNNGYYDYVLSRMNLFNDRYFILSMYVERFLNNNPGLLDDFYQTLSRNGYKPVFSGGDDPIRSLYYNDTPSSYLIPLKDQTLVIGEHAYNFAALKPNSYIAGSIDIDDYDLDFLKNFDNLVLYGFGYKDKNKAEKLVRDYAASGGHVVIDMVNMQQTRMESETIFLGVQSNLEKTSVSLALENSNNLLPSTLEIPSIQYFGEDELGAAEPRQLKEWRFTDYLNLDGTVSKWKNRPDHDGNLYSLIGYKNIDGNKIWFMGGNLIYHAYLTHNQQEQDFIRQFTTQTSVSPSTVTPGFEIDSQNLDPEAGKMDFDYTAESVTPLLVSYTISPHWKAYLDGQPIKIYNLDAMMALNLPAGTHHVTLKYENLSDHTFAKAVTGLTILVLIYLYFASRKRKAEDV